MLSRYWPILLWLIYLVVPFDLIPDVFVGPGFADDALLLGLLYWLFLRKRPPAGGGRDRSNAAGGGPAGNGGARTGAAAGRERDPYAILGLDRRADFEEIRKAYHRQANRYHPDKVAHLGQEFQDLAKVKFQDVQWAYETLAKQKGQA